MLETDTQKMERLLNVRGELRHESILAPDVRNGSFVLLTILELLESEEERCSVIIAAKNGKLIMDDVAAKLAVAYCSRWAAPCAAEVPR